MIERIFHLVHVMRLLSSDSCVVQTRNEDATVLAAITKANSMLFYETELKLRKQFFLPPYSFLIKITRAGNLDTNRQELEKIQKLLSQYQTSIYPGFIHTINKHAITHLLIHIPQKQWPDLYVINMIRSLPPSYVIDCDPLSVL